MTNAWLFSIAAGVWAISFSIHSLNKTLILILGAM